MLNYLRHRFALSEKGAKDLVKAFGACTVYDISLMLPVSLLYLFVSDLLSKMY